MNPAKLQAESPRSPAERRRNVPALIFLLAAIALTTAIRIRLLSVPLERDEGEYAYAVQHILQGIPPYQMAYNMKLPGIYGVYALIMGIFGQTPAGIHLGLAIVCAFNIVLVYVLAKRWLSPLPASAAAGAFSLLSINMFAQGFTANAEPFVLLPALGGVCLFLRSRETRNRFALFASGFLAGTGFVIKQHGFGFILFIVLLFFFDVFRQKPFRLRSFLARGTLLAAGIFGPFALTCLIMWKVGVFEKFWFWTFTYARDYLAGDGNKWFLAKHFLGLFFMTTVLTSITVWLVSAAGLILAPFQSQLKNRGMILVFFLCSFLAVCPGFYFRSHYFILLMPAASLLFAVALQRLWTLFKNVRPPFHRLAPAFLTLVLFGHTIYQNWNYFFVATPNAVCRWVYQLSPFLESLEVARFIQDNSRPEDQIAVIGSEPQICFYARRHSATSYIYTYPLMETHPYALEMQEDMIRQIETRKPRYMVVIASDGSWMPREKSHRKILNWAYAYANRHYNLVGFVDMISLERTEYLWGEQARNHKSNSKDFLLIYERKDVP